MNEIVQKISQIALAIWLRRWLALAVAWPVAIVAAIGITPGKDFDPSVADPKILNRVPKITFDRIKEQIPDVEARAPLVANRVRTKLGPQADALLRACTTPEVFLAVEKLTLGEQPIPVGGGAPVEPALTEEKLKHMVQDDRYRKRDPEFVKLVTEGYAKLFADRI